MEGLTEVSKIVSGGGVLGLIVAVGWLIIMLRKNGLLSGSAPSQPTTCNGTKAIGSETCKMTQERMEKRFDSLDRSIEKVETKIDDSMKEFRQEIRDHEDRWHRDEISGVRSMPDI